MKAIAYIRNLVEMLNSTNPSFQEEVYLRTGVIPCAKDGSISLISNCGYCR